MEATGISTVLRSVIRHVALNFLDGVVAQCDPAAIDLLDAEPLDELGFVTLQFHTFGSKEIDDHRHRGGSIVGVSDVSIEAGLEQAPNLC